MKLKIIIGLILLASIYLMYNSVGIFLNSGLDYEYGASHADVSFINRFSIVVFIYSILSTSTVIFIALSQKNITTQSTTKIKGLSRQKIIMFVTILISLFITYSVIKIFFSTYNYAGRVKEEDILYIYSGSVVLFFYALFLSMVLIYMFLLINKKDIKKEDEDKW